LHSDVELPDAGQGMPAEMACGLSDKKQEPEIIGFLFIWRESESPENPHMQSTRESFENPVFSVDTVL